MEKRERMNVKIESCMTECMIVVAGVEKVFECVGKRGERNSRALLRAGEQKQ